jgi:hypothetical protein
MRRLFCCLSVVYDRVWRRKVEMAYEELSRATRTFDKAQTSSLTSLPSRCLTRPKTTAQTVLVYYLDGADTPTESLLALWREETQRNNTPFPLWGRYFRAGNAQLKKLILFGLDRDATDRDLLDSLSFLHSFLPMPKELLTRYKLACDQESDPQRFRELAQDFDASTSSFGYDALQALQAHYADCAVKKLVIDGLLVEIERHEDTVASSLRLRSRSSPLQPPSKEDRTCLVLSPR